MNPLLHPIVQRYSNLLTFVLRFILSHGPQLSFLKYKSDSSYCAVDMLSLVPLTLDNNNNPLMAASSYASGIVLKGFAYFNSITHSNHVR